MAIYCEEVKGVFSTFRDWLEDRFKDIKDFKNDVTLKVEEFTDGVGYAVKGLDEIVKDTKEDITDILVTGNAASDIVSEANMIISDNEKKYDETYKKVHEKLFVINQMREEVFNEKKFVAKLLNRKCCVMIDIPEIISSYQEQKPSYEKIEDILPQIFHVQLYKSTIGSAIISAVNITKAKERVSNAKEYMENAKDYEVKVKKEIAKLHQMDALIIEIQNVLREEKEILKVLKNSFECNRELEDEKIADRIRILLVEPILTKDGKENVKYKETVNDLKVLIEKY